MKWPWQKTADQEYEEAVKKLKEDVERVGIDPYRPFAELARIQADLEAKMSAMRMQDQIELIENKARQEAVEKLKNDNSVSGRIVKHVHPELASE